MPRCCSSAPRKKLPPPTTTATCAPVRDDLGDLPGDAVDDVGVDADRAAAEHLAGELEQDAVVAGRASLWSVDCPTRAAAPHGVLHGGRLVVGSGHCRRPIPTASTRSGLADLEAGEAA